MTDKLFTLDAEFMFPNLQATSAEDAIQAIAEPLCKAGYVKAEFTEEVLKREKVFPTGLKIGKYNVAIPHTEAEFVNDSTIAAAILEQPIFFQRMDDPAEEIPVSIIFLLAIGGQAQHVAALGSVIKVIQNQTFLEALVNLEDQQEIVALLKKYQLGGSKDE